MDYISSTIHEYQPILVGAGCLALGYMYGRHCRCIMEIQGDAPKMSDAACCAGTKSFNYISKPAAVDPETMAMVRQWLNPAEAHWDYSVRDLTAKPERNTKRDDEQLEILPKKKEDMIWNQNVFKKQKSAPVGREVVRTKGESEHDSDDELLATKSLSRTRASVNNTKPREQHEVWELTSKDAATSCEEAKNGGETAVSSPRKGPARSFSGLGALATPHDGDDCDDESSPPGSSVEDTCRSPKTAVVCPEHRSEGDDDVDVDEQGASCAAITETVANTSSDDPAKKDVGDAMSVGGFAGLECHTARALVNDADENLNATMEVDAHKEADDFMRLELPTLPTSPPPELSLLHEQDGSKLGVGEEAADGKPAIVLMADGGEKRNKTSIRSCLAKTKSIRFRWLKKIWKRSKLWKRRNKSKHVAIPARTEASDQSGLHKHQKSNSSEKLA